MTALPLGVFVVLLSAVFSRARGTAISIGPKLPISDPRPAAVPMTRYAGLFLMADLPAAFVARRTRTASSSPRIKSSINSRARSRTALSIGSNQSSKSWGAVWASPCEGAVFMIAGHGVVSGPALKRRMIEVDHSQATPPSIPTKPATGPNSSETIRPCRKANPWMAVSRGAPNRSYYGPDSKMHRKRSFPTIAGPQRSVALC